MRKAFTSLVATLAIAAFLPASVANATVYSFTFSSFDGSLTATGQITVGAAHEVAAISGTMSGLVNQTISGTVAISASPPRSSARTARSSTTTCSITPIRISNRRVGVHDGREHGRLLEPLGNSPGNYSLWESVGGAYAVQETGRLTVAAAPELSTWAMLLAGFAGLGLAGGAARRATRRSTSAERSSSEGISGKGRLR